MHPFVLRLKPPRVLGRYEPEHILCGHGAGVRTGRRHRPSARRSEPRAAACRKRSPADSSGNASLQAALSTPLSACCERILLHLVDGVQEGVEDLRIEGATSLRAHDLDRLFELERPRPVGTGPRQASKTSQTAAILPRPGSPRLAARADTRRRRPVRGGSARSSPRARRASSWSPRAACARVSCASPSRSAPARTASRAWTGSGRECRACRCRGAGSRSGSRPRAGRGSPAEARAFGSRRSSARRGDPSAYPGTPRHARAGGSSPRATARRHPPAGAGASGLLLELAAVEGVLDGDRQLALPNGFSR